ncbi:MAG: HPr family phosphocarrier protein [Treponema sp.]|nr:HPr family phosphocarrier protein [Treponema sp.]
MRKFEYVIKNDAGIHARPAGELVKTSSTFKSKITLQCNGKEADCKKLFSILKMGIKKGDLITLIFDGEDEEEAFTTITAQIGAQ